MDNVAKIDLKTAPMVVRIGLSVDIKYINKEINGDVPEYDGPYTVIPDINKQILTTKGKQMTSNVTVTSIPTYETSNNAGTTFYIGKVENIDNA